MSKFGDILGRHINFSKEYGRPIDTSLPSFLKSELAKYIIDSKSIEYNLRDESRLNKFWMELVTVRSVKDETQLADGGYRGGFHFFSYLAKHCGEIDNTKKLLEVVNSYVEPPLPSISPTISGILFDYKESELYVCEQVDKTYKYIIILGTNKVVCIDEYGDIWKYTSKKLVNYIKGLEYREEYAGPRINKFIHRPYNNTVNTALFTFLNSLYSNDISENAIKDNEYAYRLKIGYAVDTSNEDTISYEGLREAIEEAYRIGEEDVDKVDGVNIYEVDFAKEAQLAKEAIKSESSRESIEARMATTAESSITSGTAEKAGESRIAVEAESSHKAMRSIESESSKVADELTDEGIAKMVDKFTDLILSDRKDVLSLIEKELHEKQLEEQQKYHVEQYEGEYKTRDLYSYDVVVDAQDILENTGRLLITGCTGDGKTELAYLLAHALTGEPIGKPLSSDVKGNYNRICIFNARSGLSLKSENGFGQLDRFIKHIKKNNITDNCVLICNEVQASDMGYLLGNTLWEQFNTSGRVSDAVLPSNLHLIFTGCKDRDFGIDSQVTQRIQSVEIGYISSKNRDVHEKIVKAYKDKHDNIEEILKLVEEINDHENYSIITMRKLVGLLENGDKQLGVDWDIISSYSKNLIDKLMNKV